MGSDPLPPPKGAYPSPHLFWESFMRGFYAMIVVASLTLSACNTVKGVGRDVESVGKTVAKTAD
jgi:predicted small secreted protein